MSLDALADELLAAVREHPVIQEQRLMDPARGEANARLCAAYNRLWCELHDSPLPVPLTSAEWHTR